VCVTHLPPDTQEQRPHALGAAPVRGQTHDLTLVESRSTTSGVTIQTYRPVGRATFGNVGE
jgi:hypothetical protein